MVSLPYIDLIFEARQRGEPMAAVFDRFVHWGYWDAPGKASAERADLVAAMARLDDEVVAPARLGPGQAVLDAGCGFGGTLAAINERHREMALTGLNVDLRQLRYAGRRIRPRAGNRLELVVGDACHLPFPDRSFDRVLAVECIFLFASRRRFLHQAARVLKPGGRLALSDFVPLFPPAARFGGALERRVAAGYGTPARWEEGYRAMAAAAGLRLASERDVTRHTLPTYRALARLFAEVPELSRRLVWPTRILAWLARTGLMRYRILSFHKPS